MKQEEDAARVCRLPRPSAMNGRRVLEHFTSAVIQGPAYMRLLDLHYRRLSLPAIVGWTGQNSLVLVDGPGAVCFIHRAETSGLTFCEGSRAANYQT